MAGNAQEAQGLWCSLMLQRFTWKFLQKPHKGAVHLECKYTVSATRINKSNKQLHVEPQDPF